MESEPGEDADWRSIIGIRMKAMAVYTPAPIETDPLRAIELRTPSPGRGEILVRVRTCGVCRTDLHVAEGDLPARHPRIVPGHEIVGVVDECGPGCTRLPPRARGSASHGCARPAAYAPIAVADARTFARDARFTGYDHDGGYAEFAVVREDFAYAIPDGLGDEAAAPLLCAGIIGFRAIKRAEIKPGATVGLYGFGGSAHLAIQVLQALAMPRVRDEPRRTPSGSRRGARRRLDRPARTRRRRRARRCDPVRAGRRLVPPAMEALDRGGILAVAGIYLSPIPALDYERHLFYEQELRSVTANTRADGEEFLKIAGEIPVRTHTLGMRLDEANRALNMLKHDELKGAAVLHMG